MHVPDGMEIVTSCGYTKPGIMITKQATLWSFCSLAAGIFLSCGSNTRQNERSSGTGLPVQPDSVVQTTGVIPPSVSTDEQRVRTVFAAFLQAVEGDNRELVKDFMHFPLQTSDEELKANAFDREYEKLFNADVKRGLSAADENNLSAAASGAGRYKDVQQDAEVYELSVPGSGKNAGAVTLVWGKVEGEYKVVGYYRK